MRRLLLASALLLAGCDAGNRADPGADNVQQSPTLVVSTPFEGQQVVPTAADGSVRVKFDLVGGSWGRTAGSRVRYRLQQAVDQPSGKERWEPADAPWVVVEDARTAVTLKALAPATDPQFPYRLTAEVIDKDGNPWTRTEEAVKGDPQSAREVNAGARVVRKFTVHKTWDEKASR